jgi:drug/metabolite transporter (DMT)-like permease
MSDPTSSAGAERDGTRTTEGALLVAAAAIFWSTGGLISRMVSVDSWTMVFWRSVSCALFLALFLLVRERGRIWPLFRAAGWAGVVAGACFATASTCFVLALAMTSVANILLVGSLGPFLAGLLAFFLIGERVRPGTWIAIAVAAGGVAVMMARRPTGDDLMGTLLALAIALAFAGATVTIRIHRTVRMTPAACLAGLFGAVLAWPLAQPLSPSGGDLALLWLFGAGQLGLGMACYTAGARRIPAAQGSLLLMLETVLAPIWVWLAFGENPGGWVLGGGAVILLALIGHTLADQMSAPRAQAGP